MAKSKPSEFAKAMKARSKSSPKNKRTIPFRQLDKDGVTYSFLSEFLTCREAARLSYVEGYQEIGFMESFEFGTAIHNCIEAQALAGKRTRINHHAIINKHAEGLYKKHTKSDHFEIRRVMETAKIVWPQYMKYWQSKSGMDMSDDCEVVSAEESFRVPYELPNGTEIILRGRFDEILRYKGRLWLMENKTKSVIDDRIADYLPHDMQTQMYCHAVELKYGEPVEGVLYNVIRRPGLRLGKGTLPSLLQRIEAAIHDDPEHYFMRWNVHLHPTDTKNWVKKVLDPLLLNVQLWWDEIVQNPFDPFSIPNRVHHFQSPEGLYTRYGKSRYFDLLVTGDDSNLIRRTEDREPKRITGKQSTPRNRNGSTPRSNVQRGRVSGRKK